ncbi:MAG: hypothetical protein EAX95_04035 [Candidatus Thorarchaeota archaeon]|nr:hypothetical protein [Candidatus Thorarchaeota archaeon]
MPFTPYHLGPAFLIGVIFFPALDVAALLLSSVTIDIEPLAMLMFGIPGPLHGYLHTFLGATVMAILASCVVWVLRTPYICPLPRLQLRQSGHSEHHRHLFSHYSGCLSLSRDESFFSSFGKSPSRADFIYNGVPILCILHGVWNGCACIANHLQGIVQAAVGRVLSNINAVTRQCCEWASSIAIGAR